MDEQFFTQQGLNKLLNPSKSASESKNFEAKPNLQSPESKRNQVPFDDSKYATNYFQKYLQFIKNSNQGSSTPPIFYDTNRIPSESVNSQKTFPDTLPQSMENSEKFGRIPSQDIFESSIRLVTSLLGHSEFQDMLIQGFLKNRDFCEKLRIELFKNSINQSLKK